MKISHRLLALSGVSAAGLICVAAVSYHAVTSIQSDLQGLTLRAAPLQARTLELQDRTERLMSALLKLSMARSADDAAKATAAIRQNLQATDRLRAEIRALDPQAKLEGADFRNAEQQIAQAVAKRLADAASYRKETEVARDALKTAELSIGTTRAAVTQLGVDAGQAADKAQDASRRLALVTKLALQAQTRLREVSLVVAEIDAATNRFRLGPLKEKVKAPLDSIQRIEIGSASGAVADDPLKEVRAGAVGIFDAIAADGSGLLALRAAVLAARPDADAAYQKQRKAVLEPIEAQSAKLAALADGAEVQSVKQRQVLEAALKLRNEPGGVVTTSENVSLAIRDMVGSLRLLMLAADEAEANYSQSQLRGQARTLQTDMGAMQAGLLKMGKPQLAQDVGAALAAMRAVSTSIDNVAETKLSLLASETQMAESMAALKAMGARQDALSERQVKGVAERQADVSAAVDRRVRQSLTLILGIAASLSVAIGVFSWLTVRLVKRRLDAAVRVAEAVSQGHLLPVAVSRDNDETARLMTALASMVGTLTGIVGDIRGAAGEIDAGSHEISRGNHDLSTRTEQQAAQLQETASSVQQLATTVQQNAASARAATLLAGEASHVAALGGAAVGDVAATMHGIADASHRIAEIIGVIDAIAFQTNILALNAAVEAARAGENGRGFAVVAGEVRALAGKSAAAARQIKSLVLQSVERVEAGSSLVQGAGSTMNDVVERVKKVSTLINEIARASEEQAASVMSVRSAVGNLDEMTQRNAALAQQSTAAATTLRTQAEGLTRTVSVFDSAAGLA